ncbi:hypothetical protein F0562_007197 [Nyssa sinensis]|uniref:Uncharacterized protein n=1 Tax=Nyssa sinensis TaxID=561372 RepID=A0A5J5A2U3_9ASTE|nr:hypothetical protein F0562_007197 [Nyssa sinensis]
MSNGLSGGHTWPIKRSIGDLAEFAVEVLRILKETNNEEASQPGFDDEPWTHFNRLPVRYALDVNVKSAKGVFLHKKLLHMALDLASKPAFEFRPVQVHHISNGLSFRRSYQK